MKMRLVLVSLSFALVACGGGDGGGDVVTKQPPLPVDTADASVGSDMTGAGAACGTTTCSFPPANSCVDQYTARQFSSTGSCLAGLCNYNHVDTYCANGCENGACFGVTDPCSGVTCNYPPAPTCASSTALLTYSEYGTCSGGACSYSNTTTNCPLGCNPNGEFGAQCNADLCAGVTCNSPTPATCVDTQTLRTYAASGTCSAGSCSYTSSDSTCTNGCVSGACRTTPYRMFVTRGSWTGNLTGVGNLCVSAANAAGLSGNWAMWLSTSTGTTGDYTVFDVYNATIYLDNVDGPWFATDGVTKLFNNRAALSGYPLAAINLDEYGATVTSGTTVWTGTAVGGVLADNNADGSSSNGCRTLTGSVYEGNWSNDASTVKATYGKTGTTTDAWTDYGTGACSVKRHLYCIEQ